MFAYLLYWTLNITNSDAFSDKKYQNKMKVDVNLWRSWLTQHLASIHRHVNREDVVIYVCQVAGKDERGFLNMVWPCSALK